jgi:tripartite-type tricarboxylate transporter receptor subunit TctC
VDEAGLPGFYISVWHGMWAPKGTPTDILGKLNAAVLETLADPMIRQRLGDLGQEIPPRDQQTPQGLGALQRPKSRNGGPLLRPRVLSRAN